MKRGRKAKGRVCTEWSPALAYAVGLIATDGNLSKDGRHIIFTSKDDDLIDTFQRCLGIADTVVNKKRGGYRHTLAYQVQFSDVLFYRWLLDIGLSPNKSKIIPALLIPDEYFFDFLRGCFDGDGHIYAYRDMRWRSSFMYYIGFSSASKIFLEWLNETIARMLGYNVRVKKVARAYQLSYAKTASKTLLKHMFYREDVPHLKRKFAKAKKILIIDAMHLAQVS